MGKQYYVSSDPEMLKARSTWPVLLYRTRVRLAPLLPPLMAWPATTSWHLAMSGGGEQSYWQP